MKQFAYKTLLGILLSIPLFGENISVDAPRVVLKNIEFNVSYSGDFSEQDSFALLVNGIIFSPSNITDGKVHFNQISISEITDASFHLTSGEETIHKFNRKVIPGWISILPPIIAILLAFASRAVIPSLFAAIWFGVWSLSHFSIMDLIPSLLNSFYVYILNTMIDRDHAILILFTLMLGGMVGIIYRNGGVHGIIKHLIKKADTPRKGQIAIWLFGIIIFFDDYSNTLIVGNTSRLLCDKLKISRQKLAYLVDSTSAPVATIAVITTWIGFQVGIIADALPGLEGLDESAYMLFIHSIPYSFYPFLAIVMVGLIVTSGKDFGPMVEAEERARAGIKYAPNMDNLEADAGADADELFVKQNVNYKARNAVIPIAVLVFSMLYFIFTSGEGDTLKDILGSSDTFGALMHSTLLSALTAAALSVGQRILNLNEILDAWFSGLKFMLMGLMVLLLAWALADISKDLGTADFIVSTLGDSISMPILPSIVFLIAAATAFGSGSSWGVMAILMPLVIPLTWAVMGNNGGATPENMHILYSTIACVLTGSVWADHCSPISDTTILTSMASGCELMDHVRTQMPYAVSAGAAALLLGTLPAGFGAPWWVLLLLGIGSQVIVVKIFGRKTS
ncbi:MAG: Na+/H+ antiporter NhaC family protein [Candidatus Marinimicrobia bacterium]|mgnify:FL=1|nr:Na+/H+ antiporter NhaC family protein [Candidatus Neomarinimicrobiota bacterium]MBT5116156.1 Na+/H+ antiporter NhaC family protein [Candidatus Neomarinimicrobiota bacterium]